MLDDRRAWSAIIVSGWALVALAQALQGYTVAAYRGVPQAWWPSLGYAGAIYSVWALLSWPIIGCAIAVERGIRQAWVRLALYLALWPVVAGAHVLLFAFAYWPIYRGDHIASRWDMANIMFMRNFDTNTLFYIGLLGLTIIWLRWPRPKADAQSAAPRIDVDALVVRNRGHIQRIPLDTVDWIGAAGDYAEIHGAGRTHLIEESLVSLADRLPADAFARIHRGALIRIDRVREIEAIGRGDAHVRLVSGEELRLSRRFRANLAALLGCCAPARPAE